MQCQLFTGEDWVHTKYPYVVHAVVNAILNKNAEDLTGCTLFTTLFLSNEDTKLIIQAGITEVVYCHDREMMYGHITRKMLTKAEVEYTCFTEYRKRCGKLRARECEDLAKKQRRQVDVGADRELCEKRAQEYESLAKKERSRVLKNITVYPPPGEDSSDQQESSPGPISDRDSPPISDHQYYMSVACLSKQRSKDPWKPVGACIVDRDGKVVGIGYTGWPYRISNDDPDVSWGEEGENPADVKYPYVVHAVANAIMHKTCIDLKGCRVYITEFPCNDCAKLIIQSGITKVYYLDKHSTDTMWMKASRRLLRSAGYVVTVDGIKMEEQPSCQDVADQQQRDASTQTDKKVCEEYKPECEVKIYWPPELKPEGDRPCKRRLQMNWIQ